MAESQMVMVAMWKRKLLGKRWQVIGARMQDRQEVEDMQRMGMAADRALRLAVTKKEGIGGRRTRGRTKGTRGGNMHSKLAETPQCKALCEEKKDENKVE